MRSYLIAATPRVGGTWLCRQLTDNGLGMPGEQLNWHLQEPVPGRKTLRRRAWTTDELHGLWDTYTQKDVYGVKVHFTDEFATLDLDDILPPGPRAFVHLTRADGAAQATSYALARKYDCWFTPPPADATVSASSVRRARRDLDAMNDRWEKWFAAHGITPLGITYEEAVADLAGTYLRILGHVVPPRGVRR